MFVIALITHTLFIKLLSSQSSVECMQTRTLTLIPTPRPPHTKATIEWATQS